MFFHRVNSDEIRDGAGNDEEKAFTQFKQTIVNLNHVAAYSEYEDMYFVFGYSEAVATDLSQAGDEWNEWISGGSKSLKTLSDLKSGFTVSLDGIESHSKKSRAVAAELMNANIRRSYVPSITYDAHSGKIVSVLAYHVPIYARDQFELWEYTDSTSRWTKKQDIDFGVHATFATVATHGSHYYIVNKHSKLRTKVVDVGFENFSWAWSSNSPVGGEFGFECAYFSGDADGKYRNWGASNSCTASAFIAACVNRNNRLDWKVTGSRVFFADAQQRCQSEFGTNYDFSVPRNTNERDALWSASNLTATWINLRAVNVNDLTGTWKAGG